MKKLLGMSLMLIIFSSCVSTYDRQEDRQVAQVGTGNVNSAMSAEYKPPTPKEEAVKVSEDLIKYFLAQANNKSTEIYKAIGADRSSYITGFMNNSDEIVPAIITKNQIIATRLQVYDYAGTYRGDEASSDPEDYKETAQIYVPFKSRYYGGRISVLETLSFTCEKHNKKLSCKINPKMEQYGNYQKKEDRQVAQAGTGNVQSFSTERTWPGPIDVYCMNTQRKIVKVKLTRSTGYWSQQFEDLTIIVGADEENIVLQTNADDVEDKVQAVGTGSVQINTGYGSTGRSVACAFKKVALDKY